MKKLPELKVEFIHDDSIPEEEVKRRIDKIYDILFKETIKTMQKSADPADIAFLKKFPHLKEREII